MRRGEAEAGTEIRVDRLAGPGPALELVQAVPARDRGLAPLLFLHGASTGAWCWPERFLGLIAETGRRAAALSLRGHGGSEGRGELAGATIEDFLADIARAADALPAPPVVVGHSFGGYLAQLSIRRAPMRGLVLMNALPPDGLAIVGPLLAMFEPSLWMDALTGASASPLLPRAASLERLFGPGIAEADRRHFMRRLVGESPLALVQAHMPRWVRPAAAAHLPTLVLHGAHDRLIWPSTSGRTAAYHGAERIDLPEAGHFMMLERCAPHVVALTADWLGRMGI